ncbi:MAG: hypothetical protein QGH25_10165, partial [Candidatus Latescibacteria bacterium]|nr:hypothetical protein [Candidatus Latescibacterota bacterium]
MEPASGDATADCLEQSAYPETQEQDRGRFKCEVSQSLEDRLPHVAACMRGWRCVEPAEKRHGDSGCNRQDISQS